MLGDVDRFLTGKKVSFWRNQTRVQSVRLWTCGRDCSKRDGGGGKGTILQEVPLWAISKGLLKIPDKCCVLVSDNYTNNYYDYSALSIRARISAKIFFLYEISIKQFISFL